jgi:predicted DNA-binding protein with PD1-like motif
MKMGILREVRKTDVFMGRLRHGADLLDELTEVCRQKDIKLGRIEAIGAVRKARIGFYDQEKREYEYITFDQPLEITNLTGNISIKDGSPFVHAHVTLADSSGRAYGGHLAQGTIVFACECMIEMLEGQAFERAFDSETGLSLWVIKE